MTSSSDANGVVCTPLCDATVAAAALSGSGQQLRTSWIRDSAAPGGGRSCLLPRREIVTQALPPLTETGTAQERAAGRASRLTARDTLVSEIRALSPAPSEVSRDLQRLIQSELLPTAGRTERVRLIQTLNLLRQQQLAYQNGILRGEAPSAREIRAWKDAESRLRRGCASDSCPRPLPGRLYGTAPNEPTLENLAPAAVRTWDEGTEGSEGTEGRVAARPFLSTEAQIQAALTSLNAEEEPATPEARRERSWRRVHYQLDRLRVSTGAAAAKLQELTLVQNCRTYATGYRTQRSRIAQGCPGCRPSTSPRPLASSNASELAYHLDSVNRVCRETLVCAATEVNASDPVSEPAPICAAETSSGSGSEDDADHSDGDAGVCR